MTRYEVEQWLQDGIIAAKTGRLEYARSLLLDVVEQDQANEVAWFWLYQVFERQEDKRICLENLLTINPGNQWARQELLTSREVAIPRSASQQARSAAKSAAVHRNEPASRQAAPPRPVTLKLVTAFWFGISIIFLASGIMATGEWIVSGLRSRSLPDNVTSLQSAELLVAIAFVIAGIIGLNVALGLLVRSMIGFYGSLLLALTLLLVGPLVSLIATPPNYLVMSCTGGIAGMIFFLTLASQPGFKDDLQNDE